MSKSRTLITFMLYRHDNCQDIKYNIVLTDSILIKVTHVDPIHSIETHIMDLKRNGAMVYHKDHKQFDNVTHSAIEASKILLEFMQYNNSYIENFK